MATDWVNVVAGALAARARPGRAGPIGTPGPVGLPAAARALDGLLQPGGIDRLQQVVDRVHLEAFDRVLIVRGDEDDFRGRRARPGPDLLAEDLARDLEAVHAGHLDVQEDHVRREILDQADRLDTVRRLPDHVDAAHLRQEEAQLLARQLLIVDDQGSQIHITPRPAPE